MRAFHGFSEVPLVEDPSWIDHHGTTTLHQRLLQPVGAWSSQFHGEWGDLEQVIHGSQPWQLGRGFGEVYGKFCWVFHGFPLFGSWKSRVPRNGNHWTQASIFTLQPLKFADLWCEMACKTWQIQIPKLYILNFITKGPYIDHAKVEAASLKIKMSTQYHRVQPPIYINPYKPIWTNLRTHITECPFPV